MILTGDWICETCATEVGFNVGIEGYEYASTKSKKSDDKSNPIDLTDTPEKPSKKRKENQTKMIDVDSESDAQFDDDTGIEHSDEETPVGHKRKNAKPKKQIIDFDDSDDE